MAARSATRICDLGLVYILDVKRVSIFCKMYIDQKLSEADTHPNLSISISTCKFYIHIYVTLLLADSYHHEE